VARSKIGLDDLIKSGVLTAGTVLVWPRRTMTHSAKLLATGHIRLATGDVFDTPSGAAKHLNDGRPVDGWLAWRVTDESGARLADIRETL
jgi:hypothetical protein